MAKAQKQTREEKEAIAEQARREREANDFRAEVEKERRLIVVGGSKSAMMRAFEQAGGDQKEAHLLYSMLYNVERWRTEVDQRRRWLADSLADLDRTLARGDNYSSSPVGDRGSSLDSAWAAYTTARYAAAWTCSLLGVYCPLLDTTEGKRSRALMLSVTVERVAGIIPIALNDSENMYVDGYRLMRDGTPLTAGDLLGRMDNPSADEPMNYRTDTDAWLAFRALVTGR
jgi:hypothetical protein